MAFLDKVQKWSAAVAFAEVAEFDTARQIAGIKGSTAKITGTVFERLGRSFVAVTFAEAGLFKEASDFLNPAPIREKSAAGKNFLELVGLKHAPVRMYVLTN